MHHYFVSLAHPDDNIDRQSVRSPDTGRPPHHSPRISRTLDDVASSTPFNQGVSAREQEGLSLSQSGLDGVGRGTMKHAKRLFHDEVYTQPQHAQSKLQSP